MKDIHQHLLWGIDDGPENPEGMHALLREAHAQKIDCVYATPHACPGIRPFDRALYEQRLQEAQEYCEANELNVSIFSGAEIVWTYNAVEALRRGQVPTLGGGDHVLIELWEDVSWREVRSAAEQLLRAGYVPVFAHVERYRCFRLQPGAAIRLRRKTGICYQVNASTVIKPRGLIQKYFLSRMMRAQAIDAIASDAHGRSARPLLMRRAYKTVKSRWGRAYAKKLFNFEGAAD